MKKAELKNFGKPDEVREFPKGRLELIKIGGATVGSLSRAGGGRHPFSQSPKPKAMKRHTTSRVSCEFAWTTARSSTGDTPHLGKIIDMAMLVAPGGEERTEPEYGMLLGKAGLRLTRVVPTESPVSVVEVRLA
jgi:hypothetical protein